MRVPLFITLVVAASQFVLAEETPKSLGFDGLGFTASWSEFEHGQRVQDGSLVVVVPDSKDAIIGLGRDGWVKQELKTNDSIAITPIVANQVATVKYGREVFAFSPTHSRWDRVVLKNASSVPYVGSGLVQVDDGERLHVFHNERGIWATVNLKTGEIDN